MIYFTLASKRDLTNYLYIIITRHNPVEFIQREEQDMASGVNEGGIGFPTRFLKHLFMFSLGPIIVRSYPPPWILKNGIFRVFIKNNWKINLYTPPPSFSRLEEDENVHARSNFSQIPIILKYYFADFSA